MKALLVTFVLVVAVVWAVVHFSGMTSWDPAAQAEEFKTLAVPGTDWEVLVEEMKPQTYRTYYEDPDLGLTQSTSMKFNRELFDAGMADGRMDNGFVLEYMFTAGEGYDLYFGGDGKLESTGEPITTKHLLDGTATQKLGQ